MQRERGEEEERWGGKRERWAREKKEKRWDWGLHRIIPRMQENLKGKIIANHNSYPQGFGSGSGSVMDPYSIGPVDPDPDPGGQK